MKDNNHPDSFIAGDKMDIFKKNAKENPYNPDKEPVTFVLSDSLGIRLSIRFTKEEFDGLIDIAEEAGLSLVAYVKQLIEEKVEKYKNNKGKD